MLLNIYQVGNLCYSIFDRLETCVTQYLTGWIIETFYGSEVKDLIIKSIQPVGEGLSFSDIEINQKMISSRLLNLN